MTNIWLASLREAANGLGQVAPLSRRLSPLSAAFNNFNHKNDPINFCRKNKATCYFTSSDSSFGGRLQW